MTLPRFCFALTCMTALGACMASAPDQPRQAAKPAKTSAAAAEVIEHGVLVFEVNAERTVAMASVKDASVKLSENQIEAAARKATGCKADFDPGVLAMLGGYTPDAPIPLSANTRMAVRLSC